MSRPPTSTTVRTALILLLRRPTPHPLNNDRHPRCSTDRAAQNAVSVDVCRRFICTRGASFALCFSVSSRSDPPALLSISSRASMALAQRTQEPWRLTHAAPMCPRIQQRPRLCLSRLPAAVLIARGGQNQLRTQTSNQMRCSSLFSEFDPFALFSRPHTLVVP